jgi:hypothetical protein
VSQGGATIAIMSSKHIVNHLAAGVREDRCAGEPNRRV